MVPNDQLLAARATRATPHPAGGKFARWRPRLPPPTRHFLAFFRALLGTFPTTTSAPKRAPEASSLSGHVRGVEEVKKKVEKVAFPSPCGEPWVATYRWFSITRTKRAQKRDSGSSHVGAICQIGPLIESTAPWAQGVLNCRSNSVAQSPERPVGTLQHNICTSE